MKQHWNGKPNPATAAPDLTETETALERMGFPLTTDRLPALTDAEVMQVVAAAFAEPSDHAGQSGDAHCAKCGGQIGAAAPDPTGDLLQAVLALVRAHGQAVAVPVPQPRRRAKASPKWIADTLRLIQERGLTPTGIVHRPDGSTVIEIGNPPAPEKRKPKGWDI
ncbi:hypothetical protein GIY56_02045 [Paracoccus sp. YIM 132242]|uniref:Uncharacterized protein n=1 Tax=Paracoccus lichenicola TaxID=2665644 RepID=A0A6L6HLV9_9RHOB|nr:hypothetical protein [Paracoccus lichenicola]MTD99064.1 hypothetical protein [Paracoccus lichenicola]